jgi:hypothetical protein
VVDVGATFHFSIPNQNGGLEGLSLNQT